MNFKIFAQFALKLFHDIFSWLLGGVLCLIFNFSSNCGQAETFLAPGTWTFQAGPEIQKGLPDRVMNPDYSAAHAIITYQWTHQFSVSLLKMEEFRRQEEGTSYTGAYHYKYFGHDYYTFQFLKAGYKYEYQQGSSSLLGLRYFHKAFPLALWGGGGIMQSEGKSSLLKFERATRRIGNHYYHASWTRERVIEPWWGPAAELGILYQPMGNFLISVSLLVATSNSIKESVYSGNYRVSEKDLRKENFKTRRELIYDNDLPHHDGFISLGYQF